MTAKSEDERSLADMISLVRRLNSPEMLEKLPGMQSKIIKQIELDGRFDHSAVARIVAAELDIPLKDAVMAIENGLATLIIESKPAGNA